MQEHASYGQAATAEPTDATLIAHEAVPNGRQSAVSSYENGREWTPTALCEVTQSMSTEGTEGDNVCPTCGTEFKNLTGVKIHHKQAHGESIAGAEVECAACGATKLTQPSRAREQERHYCDDQCRGEWQRENWDGETAPGWEGGRVAVECAWCGTPKEVDPHVAADNKNHFCDPQCQGEWLAENALGEDNPAWNRVETECAWCGAEKTVPQRENESYERHFCDTECAGEWQSKNLVGEHSTNWKGGKAELVCEQCGEAYRVKRAVVEDSRFCSRKCLSEWQAEQWTGAGSPRWNGGEYPYGEGWTTTLKERVRDRQDRKCAGCGMDESDHPTRLPVHHIMKARNFDDDEPRNDDSNLVALCQDCHPTWERMSPLRPIVPKRGDGS